VKLVLDPSRCAGHGRCYDLAPSLIAPDDDGHAVVLIAGEIPPDAEAAAQAAARNCPERALRIVG
jgi:ferredoxin